jgi:hypothetical protein
MTTPRSESKTLGKRKQFTRPKTAMRYMKQLAKGRDRMHVVVFERSYPMALFNHHAQSPHSVNHYDLFRGNRFREIARSLTLTDEG